MSEASVFTRWASLGPQLQAVLRLVCSSFFILTGAMKLFAIPVSPFPAGGTVPLISLLGLAGVLEVFGGGLVLLGLFTRPVAFILSGEMAVAYFMGHFPKGFWPMLNQGMPAVLYCFLWLYFSAAGAGPWSLDALRERKVQRAERLGDRLSR